MKFRPCIDIHNGQVKQVVGSTIRDENDSAKENFVSVENADYYAKLYEKLNLNGGHIILLNSKDSKYYSETKQQALNALKAFKGGMQVGGGINPENALEFIEAGASHVIVTSYVFSDGKLKIENLKKISEVVGKDRLVIDLSCRKKDDTYYIVTDRWQKFTEEKIEDGLLERLSKYCDEFLVHAVDVEGKNNGIELPLVKILGKWDKTPITYAGGIKSGSDIEILGEYSNMMLDFTIGSALDLFGGNLDFYKIAEKYRKNPNYTK